MTGLGCAHGGAFGKLPFLRPALPLAAFVGGVVSGDPGDAGVVVPVACGFAGSVAVGVVPVEAVPPVPGLRTPVFESPLRVG